MAKFKKAVEKKEKKKNPSLVVGDIQSINKALDGVINILNSLPRPEQVVNETMILIAAAEKIKGAGASLEKYFSYTKKV